MEKYYDLMTYIMAQQFIQTPDNKVVFNMKWTKIIMEISIMIGKMHVYHDKGDKENFGYIETQLETHCSNHAISLDDFEEWREEQKNGNNG
jgi:hypothetical protein